MTITSAMSAVEECMWASRLGMRTGTRRSLTSTRTTRPYPTTMNTLRLRLIMAAHGYPEAGDTNAVTGIGAEAIGDTIENARTRLCRVGPKNGMLLDPFHFTWMVIDSDLLLPLASRAVMVYVVVLFGATSTQC